MITNNKTQILSVSQLNRFAKQVLEQHFFQVWVEGEISNFIQASSGHWYFTLKDKNSQVRCAMFRGQNVYVRQRPKNGEKVQVKARVSLYEGRGDFQLIVDQMEAAGFGALQQQFEQLKQDLQQQGLFDPQHKQAIPRIPKHIGVITSPSGAAIRDVLSVLKRRMPSIPITVIPSPVQGDEAPAQLIYSLKKAQTMGIFDVLLLCRGGGSIEDLWAFNNEQLAHNIFQCPIPIVSAVGHEVDFTIADFVADVRAPTPSAAAELLSPNAEDIQRKLQQGNQQLERHILNIINLKLDKTIQLHQRLKHPRDKLEQWSQTLDQFDLRLKQGIRGILQAYRGEVDSTQKRLLHESPEKKIRNQTERLNAASSSLKKALRWHLDKQQVHYQHLMQNLDKASPLNIMKRGYSITSDDNGHVLQSVSQLKENQSITIDFADGRASAITKTITKK